MVIDRFNFLLIAGALASGGVGGWVFRGWLPTAPTRRTAAAPMAVGSGLAPTASIAVRVDARVGTSAGCDDSRGTAEDCPTIGPEGVCANIVLKRCQEFKAAFEPRVAARAIACLRALKPSDRCDFGRVNQCGHLALMAACPDPSSTLIADACETIQKNCGGQPLSPTLVDCRQTVAGLNEVGRASMVDCVSAHCTDRGLYGCEAVLKTIGVASVGGVR